MQKSTKLDNKESIESIFKKLKVIKNKNKYKLTFKLPLFAVILLVIFLFFNINLISCKINLEAVLDNKELNKSYSDTNNTNDTNTSKISKETDINNNNMEKEIITLPQPNTDSNFSLEKALFLRRSVRSFSDKKIELEKISQLLWAAQGITKQDSGFRTAPSAGALYPLEVYLLKEDGIFHYNPKNHALEVISNTDKRQNLYQACLFQDAVMGAAINIVIVGVYERTIVKYGKRGIRYVDMEVGHACQNILLQAVALELGAVPIGAFNDNEVQKILNLPNNYSPLYVVPVGYPY